jgi:hypothetical protein
LGNFGSKHALTAHCEFGHFWILRLRRMSGLTGHTAAIDGGDERQQWAVLFGEGRIADAKMLRPI